MADNKDKFKIDAEKLKTENISIVQAIYNEGTDHLHYFLETNKLFQFPHLRIKCFDTIYYEKMMPIVIQILRDHKQLNG